MMPVLEATRSPELSSTDPSYRRYKPASPARLIALAVVVGIGVGIGWVLLHTTNSLLLTTSFPQQGLVTNEFAYEHPLSPQAVVSPIWEATSGSLFGRDGAAWTGVPDGVAPGPTSAAHNDSAVFRLRTRRADFNNVAVSFQLRVNRFVTTPRTPAQAYDGIHVWLRYQDPETLYFVSVDRRDGQLVIGKKLNGKYYHELRVRGHPFPLNQWVTVKTSVVSDGNKVVIRLYLDGRDVAHLTDGGSIPAILAPGRVGIRGDNTEAEFKSFRVTTA
jgi:hypothetical protein